MEKHFEFKVKKSYSQRYKVGCMDNSCLWHIRTTRIEGLDLFLLGYSRRHMNADQLKI